MINKVNYVLLDVNVTWDGDINSGNVMFVTGSGRLPSSRYTFIIGCNDFDHFWEINANLRVIHIYKRPSRFFTNFLGRYSLKIFKSGTEARQNFSYSSCNFFNEFELGIKFCFLIIFFGFTITFLETLKLNAPKTAF
jgi:hypothetical protein